ncbi:hypothetical protein, partial [Escherichia coli]|uniref:hypothetical protein n=1 Tax=Escherichia coli TaxID=562 RepID=UPI001BB4748B
DVPRVDLNLIILKTCFLPIEKMGDTSIILFCSLRDLLVVIFLVNIHSMCFRVMHFTIWPLGYYLRR